jgi:prolyl 4-hydroxylase
VNFKQLTKGIFTVEGFLDPPQCAAMIRRIEAKGFEQASISTSAGTQLEQETRNNDRVIMDDPNLANELWTRIQEFTPRVLLGRQARGLNERFRFYRYKPGQKFAWHVDGAFRRDNGEMSQLTFMVYLNEGYRGGATRFEEIEVAGHLGMALVFEHALFHEGAEVLEGVKYVLRSDVMYGAVGKIYG